MSPRLVVCPWSYLFLCLVAKGKSPGFEKLAVVENGKSLRHFARSITLVDKAVVDHSGCIR